MSPASDVNQRAKEVFMAAIELESAEQRLRFVAEACAGDVELRRNVDELLTSFNEAGSFMENRPGDGFEATMDSNNPAAAPIAATMDSNNPAGPALEATTAPASLAKVGTVIAGRYKLLEAIGDGGMGSVWVAEQSKPVKRKVAIKLIKAGLDTREVLARFDAERQALALMDHPNIARVLDGGMTEQGRPYFAMEYVKGVPLTEYCDQARLTVRQRLELFLPICNAVQHAHQKGVIHRDLKPANILVCLYDGKPIPKVIDFGLAKAVHQSLTDHTLHTGTGIMLGTPLYMSPEQAETNNLDIDTRTDVYSLGVILYELLTGSTPLEKAQFKQAALDEMMRLIREVEPPRPSTRLSGNTSLPGVAAQRNIDPAQLTRSLSGDLDWVVMKALEKERDRRYETANSLAADILRHLADEPVSATPPTVRYRFQKFVKRNRAGVLAASLLALALLLGLTGTTAGMVWALNEREAAEVARNAESQARQAAENSAETARLESDRAEAEKQIALAVNDFLQHKLLGQADPITQADDLLLAGGLAPETEHDPTIRELLDRAAEELSETNIEENFPGQPLLQAEIMQTVGSSYSAVGNYEQGIHFTRRALALRRQHLGDEHPDTLNSMYELAGNYAVAGQWNDALQLVKENLELRQRRFGAEHPDTLKSMGLLVLIYVDSGQWNEALPLAEKTLALCRQHLGAEHRTTLVTMNHLSRNYMHMGQLDKAVPLLEELVELTKASLGPQHPLSLSSMGNLAAAYGLVGQNNSVLLVEELLPHLKTRLGPEHPFTLTYTANLAVNYLFAGQLEKAQPLVDETLQLHKAKLGPDHPQTLSVMTMFATAYLNAGRPERALPLLKEALPLQRAALGAEHPTTLYSTGTLAGVYLSVGQPGRALTLLETTLPLQKAAFGPSHPVTLGTTISLALAYELDGQRDLAEQLTEETLPIMKASLGPDHYLVLASSYSLARLYLSAGRFIEAEVLLRDCLARYERVQPDTWRRFYAQSLLGSALLGLEQHAEAETQLLAGYEGLKQHRQTIPQLHELRPLEPIESLIKLYTATNRPDEAATWKLERDTWTSGDTPPLPVRCGKWVESPRRILVRHFSPTAAATWDSLALCPLHFALCTFTV